MISPDCSGRDGGVLPSFSNQIMRQSYSCLYNSLVPTIPRLLFGCELSREVVMRLLQGVPLDIRVSSEPRQLPLCQMPIESDKFLPYLFECHRLIQILMQQGVDVTGHSLAAPPILFAQ